MRIVSALFVDNIELSQVSGTTKIDMSGIHFSLAGQNPPTTLTPHLVVLVWNPPESKPLAALTVTFHYLEDVDNADVEPLARNVQPLEIEPGMFNYRLIRAELEFDTPRTVVAKCRIDDGDAHLVPFTLKP